MQKKIQSALISVFYKDGLETIIQSLDNLGISIYSTGGTQQFIEGMGVKCIPVESLTTFPSILGGRVKTLHPSLFGAILGKRNDEKHVAEMKAYNIPEIDLVIVDLYPFEETVKATTDETLIIEKIDIGGPSMIRAAAKNHQDVVVIASKKDYHLIEDILQNQSGETTLDQRRMFAIKAFDVCASYDIAISNYFNKVNFPSPFSTESKVLRYGENPHQQAAFFGELNSIFTQLHGKELSYNNLVDVDAAIQLINDFDEADNKTVGNNFVFAIIKHTNVCGIAKNISLKSAWESALAGDPESAFGGVLVCNAEVDSETAGMINGLFFEVLIAPSYSEEAMTILKSKKNRILLTLINHEATVSQSRSLLNGVLMQENDVGNFAEWKEVGGRDTSEKEKENLVFANIICKHLKSNAIALVSNMQLVGKGCGQTSRIDALRNAIEKADQFDFQLEDAVLASDAFFPFDDCVKIAHAAGIAAFIQPGGSVRDEDSVAYCKQNSLAMVMTGMRHFKH